MINKSKCAEVVKCWAGSVADTAHLEDWWGIFWLFFEMAHVFY